MISINKLFAYSTVLFALTCHSAFGIADIPCLRGTIDDPNSTFIQEIDGKFSGKAQLVDEDFDNNKSFWNKIAADLIWDLCGYKNHQGSTDIMQIAEATEKLEIYFFYKGIDYIIEVNPNTFFQYSNGKNFAIWVYKNNNMHYPGDTISFSSIPKNEWFFSDECSDHVVYNNLDSSTGVSKAGEAAFTQHRGGDRSEYFLDFPKGKSCRTFPGLVREDVGGWGKSTIVHKYQNYKTAYSDFLHFANALRSTECVGQGLAVYLVEIPTSTQDNRELSSITIASEGEPL